MLQVLIHSLVEPIINKVLSYDHTSDKKLEKLNNKHFAVTLSDLSIQLKISVVNKQVRLSTNIENSDCTVKTDFQTLPKLSDSSQITQLIRLGKLDLDGDIHIAQAFSSLFGSEHINWQSLMSNYIGDANAYRVQYAIKQLTTYINKKQIDFSYTLSSAITDEVKLAPTQLEVEQFNRQVDNLHAQVERLEQCINKYR